MNPILAETKDARPGKCREEPIFGIPVRERKVRVEIVRDVTIVTFLEIAIIKVI
jgi:hypothetical protein